jgi:hypothetical protein
MMPPRDTLSDGESEATPRGGAASRPVKPIEHTLALFESNAGSTVGDFQHRLSFLSVNCHIHRAALRLVRSRIVGPIPSIPGERRLLKKSEQSGTFDSRRCSTDAAPPITYPLVAAIAEAASV